ncbi:hypothetical protein BEH94_07160 [Candidatus Altiarchaeales archaeon WOR_SM1_SCG]|nr:hypothetical protein BEH94_07160 [Candidatus Altiarchaeales archaeon WOR_SM1_SCG]
MKNKATEPEENEYLFDYLELYRTAFYGLQVCLHGLEGKLRNYKSAVSAKKVEKTKKTARDIEVLLQSQHRFSKVLNIQSKFILHHSTQTRCGGILAYLINSQESVKDPKKGIKIIEKILNENPDIVRETGIEDIYKWLKGMKEKPGLCGEYIALTQVAVIVLLMKNYEEIINNYEEFTNKALLEFERARKVFAGTKGIIPAEYKSDILPPDPQGKIDRAINEYIRENIDPHTHKAYR